LHVKKGGFGRIFVLVCTATEAAMSGTRKLAAIPVADIVGYSRLAGADARCRGFEGSAAI